MRGKTVFNLKLSVIAAGAAFVLSLIIGFISRAAFFHILLRALASGGLFFFLSAFAYWVISQFVPELLDLGEDDASPGGLPLPGSNVDITVDSAEDEDTDMLPPLDQQYTGAQAAPETAQDGVPELFSPAPPPGQSSANTGANQALDLGDQDGYTNGGVSVNAGAPGAKPEGTLAAAIPGTADMVDTLPDLELLSTAFAPSEEEEAGEEAFIPTDIGGISGSPQGKKSSAGQGDFNVKEMAQAIQTILKKDEKG
jgi:hypothetical protein